MHRLLVWVSTRSNEMVDQVTQNRDYRFIYWGLAYLTMYPGMSKWAGPRRSFETSFNYFLIALGFYVLVAGTYVSLSWFCRTLS